MTNYIEHLFMCLPSICRSSLVKDPFNFFFFFFLLFRAAPVAYEDLQAKGLIRATAAGLCHSNTRSEPHMRPTSQLKATLDP